jgi:mycothiol S-conjugate amidase
MKRMTEREHEEVVTTTIDIKGFQDVRRDALRAHATQVDPNSKMWFGLPPEVMRSMEPTEGFLLAQSRVGGTDVTEDDLFTGVRPD